MAVIPVCVLHGTHHLAAAISILYPQAGTPCTKHMTCTESASRHWTEQCSSAETLPTISSISGPFSRTYFFAKAVALLTDRASIPSTQTPATSPQDQLHGSAFAWQCFSCVYQSLQESQSGNYPDTSHITLSSATWFCVCVAMLQLCLSMPSGMPGLQLFATKLSAKDTSEPAKWTGTEAD